GSATVRRCGRRRELVSEQNGEDRRGVRNQSLRRRSGQWRGPAHRARPVHPTAVRLLRMTDMKRNRVLLAFAIVVAATIGFTLASGRVTAQSKPATLLNVSYDPTRELYQEINAAFAKA